MSRFPISKALKGHKPWRGGLPAGSHLRLDILRRGAEAQVGSAQSENFVAAATIGKPSSRFIVIEALEGVPNQYGTTVFDVTLEEHATLREVVEVYSSAV